MKAINTDKAPAVIWPYSQAMQVWEYIFFSWQIGFDPVTMELPDWIEAQTEQICKNIWAILESQGLNFWNVVKTTIFLIDMSKFAQVNGIYGKYFSHKPARSTIEVSWLPKWALIEIELIATFN